MPSGWLKERALGGSSLGCGEDAWFCAPPSRHALRSAHCPAAPAPRAALVPGSARLAVPVPHAVPVPQSRSPCPRRACARQCSPRRLAPPPCRPACRPAPRLHPAALLVASHPPPPNARAAPRPAAPPNARRAAQRPPRRRPTPAPRAPAAPRPAHHRAPRRASAPTAPHPAPALPARSESAQINSNFPYLVKNFLDGLRFTSYLSQLHFFADSRILLKEERPRGPRKNR